MSAFILLFFCVLFIWYSIRKFNTLANPISVYCGAWGLALLCSQLFIYIYHADAVSLRMYLYIFLTICIFTITCSCWKGKHYTIQRENDDQDDIKYKMIVIFNIAAFISLLPFLRSSIQEMKLTSVVNVRANRMLGSGTEFIWQTIIKNVFIFPVFLSTIYLAIDAMIFNYSKHKWKLLTLAILDAILYTITYLGRLMIIQIFLFMAILYCFKLLERTSRNKNDVVQLVEEKKAKKTKWIIFLLSVASVVALWYLTSLRKANNSQGVIYTVLAYFGGPIRFGDIEISLARDQGSLTYGLGLFSGGWDYILMIIQRVLGIDFIRPQETIGVYLAGRKSIGGGMVMTAFTTGLLNMYLDIGIIGIVFDSFVLGYISMKLYGLLHSRNDTRHRLFVAQTLMFISSIALHWEGNRITAYMVFFYFVVFVSSNKPVLRLKVRR